MKLCLEEKLLVVLLGLTVAASLLLISAAPGVEEGHLPWRPGSVLHFLTRLLNFDGQYPTPNGDGVKRLAQGIGSAAAVALAGLMWYRRHTPAQSILPDMLADAAPTAGAAPARRWQDAVAAVDGAQAALLLLVGFSFLSTAWSGWREVALGSSALMGIGAVWAVALGRGLSRRGAAVGAGVLVGLLAASAVLGLWYHAERNPLQRLKFPLGNPLFLAACLVPGLMVGAAAAAGCVHGAVARRRWPSLAWGAVAVAAIGPIAWALWLTGSRGAVVALCGGVVLLLFQLSRYVRGWKGQLLWALLIACVMGAVYLGQHWLQREINTLEGGRGATIRLRLYAWRYAWRMFLERPLQGWGAGGYYLHATEMSRPDAERDPLAFTGELLGHAHNEWLELTAEFGAVGFMLAAVAYGLTFWACLHALRRPPAKMSDWLLLGLTTSLGALLIEEATDTALRFPGLPAVWYTVLGLIWALTRIESEPAQRAIPFPRAVVLTGLGAGMAAAVVVFTWSLANWKGALAVAACAEYTEQQRWQPAIEAAEAGCGPELVGIGFPRMGPEEVTGSLWHKFLAHANVAGFHLAEAQRAIEEAGGRMAPESPAAGLLQTDLNVGRTHVFAARQDAARLLNGMRAYPGVAGQLARLLILLVQVERAAGTDLRPEDAERIADEARQLLMLEYLRDRLSASAAVQCAAANAKEPVEVRLAWLCTGLRGGMIPGEYRAAIAELAQDAQFEAALNRRIEAARQAYAQPRAEDWPDPFAPETLRIWALAVAMQGRWAEAERIAALVPPMYRLVRVRYPLMLAIALEEQAGYAFTAAPDSAGRAARLAQEALEAVPAITIAEDLADVIRQSLSMYRLADGDESGAAVVVGQVLGTDDPTVVMERVGLVYVDLARRFLGVRPDSRPMMFSLWLRRAKDLVPESPELRLVRAQLAFEAGDDAALIRNLKEAQQYGVDPRHIDELVLRVASARPDSEAVRQFVRERGLEMPASRPATAPASRPTPGPAPATTQALPEGAGMRTP